MGHTTHAKSQASEEQPQEHSIYHLLMYSSVPRDLHFALTTQLCLSVAEGQTKIERELYHGGGLFTTAWADSFGGALYNSRTSPVTSRMCGRPAQDVTLRHGLIHATPRGSQSKLVILSLIKLRHTVQNKSLLSKPTHAAGIGSTTLTKPNHDSPEFPREVDPPC
jgi:hypothetical protein